MCFSTTASFASAAILIPAGLVCLNKARKLPKPYWAFALFPIIFGIQQALEGGVWWALNANGDNTETLRLSALGFLFFSHLFWLTWVPYSSYLTETILKRKSMFMLIALVGTVFGLSIFSPFILYPNWLTISIINHAIEYQTTLVYDSFLPKDAVTAVYLLIITIPLIGSCDRHQNILGGLIAVSMVVSLIFFNFAFISVWCYFAAVISLYIYYMIATKAVSEKSGF